MWGNGPRVGKAEAWLGEEGSAWERVSGPKSEEGV